MEGTRGRRSLRQADTRKRSKYLEPDTDDDFEIDPTTSPPPRRRKRLEEHESSTRASQSRQPKAASKPRRRPSAPRRARSKKTVAVLGKPRKARASVTPESVVMPFSGPSDGRIPNWASLPVDILREIFVFASQPNHERTADSKANTLWLLRASRICRAFTLPALEALYKSPSFFSSAQLHNFLSLLKTPNEKRLFDYNVKVKRLAIFVEELAYVAHNKPPFDLTALIAQTPQLQHLELLHPSHRPPYRPVKLQRWSFSPSQLFPNLASRDVKLKSWRWSRETLPKTTPLELYSMMAELHRSPAFERLTHLTVSGFIVSDSLEPTPAEVGITPDNEENIVLPGLATSISNIPNLQSLSFISCDIIMDTFLQRLPTSLNRLEISNCLEITSDMMVDFFKTSGSLLQHLTFNNNPALNLSFLTSLRTLCPQLRTLKVDLHYYSERLVTSDAEALYDHLLTSDEVPTWPSTMQHIEIKHAQKWTADAAQSLFRSLIESSPQLPDLRCLVLHTHMDIPWRDRAGFRDQWIHRLRRVYLRRSAEPCKYLGSFRQFRLWKGSADGNEAEAATTANDVNGHHSWTDNDDGDITMTNASSTTSKPVIYQVQISPHKPSPDTQVFPDAPSLSSPSAQTSGPSRQPRRSKRVAETKQQELQRLQQSHMLSDDESSQLSSDSIDTDKEYPDDAVQGLCTTVDIHIDNQRPRENQWTADDFLDSERSGDDDWREDADISDEGGYAW